ncbi:caspase-3-like [Dendronephthya gigantea]|uniref:caspase-3-like n=1 Tax=Dendronephthya gigantea TaxID=151771 RepID=UPI0010693F61|nr:caspase-3-like [Dendronephthya gigantea]
MIEEGQVMIITWFKSVWSWLWNIAVYFRSKIDSSSNGHDSDVDGVFIDSADNAQRRSRPSIGVARSVPTRKFRNLKDDTVHLTNPYCVVIVNIFYKNRVSPRNGAQADLENIQRLLKDSAGFKSVHVHVDVTRRNILEIMDEVSNSSEMDNHDGLVVFISSHGKAKGIIMADNETVKVDEITSRVNGKQCDSLWGKPKIFFISACRGKKKDAGATGPQLVTSDSGEDEKLAVRLPTEADFLICYSTSKGFISYRRFNLDIKLTPDMGTWLISTVTQIFEERMKDEDIMQMLTRVNATVASKASGGDHVDGMKQMPVQMHMLRHRVFFGK